MWYPVQKLLNSQQEEIQDRGSINYVSCSGKSVIESLSNWCIMYHTIIQFNLKFVQLIHYITHYHSESVNLTLNDKCEVLIRTWHLINDASIKSLKLLCNSDTFHDERRKKCCWVKNKALIVVLLLDSDWLTMITWPGHWPLIGWLLYYCWLSVSLLCYNLTMVIPLSQAFIPSPGLHALFFWWWSEKILRHAPNTARAQAPQAGSDIKEREKQVISKPICYLFNI